MFNNAITRSFMWVLGLFFLALGLLASFGGVILVMILADALR